MEDEFLLRLLGWPFPTSWSAVSVKNKTFRAPQKLSEAELSAIHSLQAVKVPDLYKPFERLFQLTGKWLMKENVPSSALPSNGSNLEEPRSKLLGLPRGPEKKKRR
ncbi:hypothetical protein Taro_029300 [Colocasia esculenta]|uniref:Uncharacterized protein n=1 Tax=Colocasia esculenta TaxID=4460 RepID=A0A843VZV7_COLES|nr:hypothetical protein [Colocasia esculenta]